MTQRNKNARAKNDETKGGEPEQERDRAWKGEPTRGAENEGATGKEGADSA